MHFRGVSAGMSQEEVRMILGEPTDTKAKDEELHYFYYLDDNTTVSLYFYKKRWLYKIFIVFPTVVPINDLGLTSEGGQGFVAIKYDYGAKIWKKTYDTEKFGKIEETYRAKPGDKTFTLIYTKTIRIINPLIFEK